MSEQLIDLADSSVAEFFCIVIAINVGLTHGLTGNIQHGFSVDGEPKLIAKPREIGLEIFNPTNELSDRLAGQMGPIMARMKRQAGVTAAAQYLVL